jgi:hypothetical protein
VSVPAATELARRHGLDYEKRNSCCNWKCKKAQ